MKPLEPMSQLSRKMHEKRKADIAANPESARKYIETLHEKLKVEIRIKDSWRIKYHHSQQTDRSLRMQIRNLKADARSLKLSLDAADEHIRTLNTIIDGLRAELKDVSEQVSEYLTKLTQEKRRYEARIKEIRQNYKKKLEEMQEAIDRLRSQLEKKDQALEDLYNSNKRMIRLLNQDSENSGWTTETDHRNPKQKKNTVNRHNSRQKTGRKPGGQHGHAGHPRRSYKPDTTVTLPEPAAVEQHPEDYSLAGEKERRLTDIQIVIKTTSYVSKVYRNNKTGKTVYTPFPKGVVNEQNYGDQLRAMAFLLTGVCNVSIQKTISFIRDITGGEVCLSAGMINNLNETFSRISKGERLEIYKKLIAGHYLNHDLTLIKVNGKRKPVAVSVNKEAVQLDLLNNKKKESIQSGPIKDFMGVGITDHDPSYRSLFQKRQECLVHIFRYLKDSEENEPERKWNREMDDYLHELIKKAEKGMSEEEIEKEEAEYMRILDEGVKEYKENPPEAWYPNGQNTLERMRENPEDYLRFLRDKEIPWHNNDAEVVARQIKRKLKNAGTFRSMKGAQVYLNNLALLITAKKQGKELFEEILELLQKEKSKS